MYRHSGLCSAVSSPKLGSHLNSGDSARGRRTVLLALAAMGVVLAIDTALGDTAVLAELLVAGPLIAATGATARHTAAVALLALVISVPAGLLSDAFGSGAHVTGIIVVAMGGVLSVLSSRACARSASVTRPAWRSSTAWRERSRSPTPSTTRPRGCSRRSPGRSGRELAQFWTMDDDDKLRRVAAWRERDLDFDDVRARRAASSRWPAGGAPRHACGSRAIQPGSATSGRATPSSARRS